jgi:hypothetical protein
VNNLRDLFAYTLDFWDVVLFQHRWYRYCQFVYEVFTEDSINGSEVTRLLQPLWERAFGES